MNILFISKVCECIDCTHWIALVKRHEGLIDESLRLFQEAAALNPHNVENMKQIGRSVYV